MTREEAEARVRALAEEHPEQSFFAREHDGEWEVVTLPGLPGRRDADGTAAEARPRPEPDDTRTSFDRNVGGPWGFG